MNLFLLLLSLFGLFSQANILVAGKRVFGIGGTVFSSVDFVRNVYISVKESGNILEFIHNIEEQERRQKILEGQLRKIQNSLYELKKVVEKLEFKIDLRHFETLKLLREVMQRKSITVPKGIEMQKSYAEIMDLIFHKDYPSVLCQLIELPFAFLDDLLAVQCNPTPFEEIRLENEFWTCFLNAYKRNPSESLNCLAQLGIKATKEVQKNVVYRMKQIYRDVQKFLVHPSHSTKNGLLLQCRIHPPNIILDILNELLNGDWLIDQAKAHKYESPALEELIAKLDIIVEALVISQSACSGVLNEGQYDFPQMVDTVKEIWEEVRRSEAVVHRDYFNYTKIFVKEYLLDYSNKNNLHIGIFINGNPNNNTKLAAKLLGHFRKKYNYGPLYTVGVGSETILYYSGMTFFGNLQAEHSYTIKHDKLHVFVLRAPSECDAITDVHVEDIVSINDNEEKRYTAIPDLAAELSKSCSKKQDYSEWFDQKCGQNFTCFYGQGCSYQDPNRAFVTNGGLCMVYYKNRRLYVTQPIIAKSFPTNYVFRPITKPSIFVWVVGNIRDGETQDSNVTLRTLKSEKSLIFTQKENVLDGIQEHPLEYIEKKSLFIEQNFGILTVINLATSFEIVTTKAPTFFSSTTENKVIQTEKEYSSFKAGHNYIFKGKIICDNGNSVGDQAYVNLIEVDDFSSNDVVATTPIVNGLFSVKIGSEYDDFMSSEIELLIHFVHCCGYQNSRLSGVLRNVIRIKYTLLDESEYARVSKHHKF